MRILIRVVMLGSVVMVCRGAEPDGITLRPVPAVTVKSPDGVVQCIDFGKAWFGRVVIHPDAVNRGREITVRLSEKLDSRGRIDPKPPGSVRTHITKLKLESDACSPGLGPGDARRMPRSIGAVMPFRYVEIDGWQGELKPRQVEMLAAVATQFQAVGQISCGSDARLNSIWDLSSHTMGATSFCGLFVDGDRERLPYEADAYINQLGWYAVTGDPVVARRTFEDLIVHPTWPTEWQSQMVLMAWADYLHTGDRGFLTKHYERLKFLTLRERIGADGLVSTVSPALDKDFLGRARLGQMRDIVDWPAGERDGYEMLPVNTVVNAFCYIALVRVGQIAEVLGKPDEAAALRAQAAGLAARIEQQLVDPATGLFVDGLGSKHSSAHATFFPMAFGLVPAARRAPALAHLKARIAARQGGFPCSVYGAQFLLEALFENGGDQAALNLIENRTDRGWIHMIETVGSTVTLEAWDQKYKPNLDWNHAWGAAPANIFPRYLIGVRPTGPAWSSWVCRPSAAFLARLSDQAAARIPTPRGLIEVSMRQQPARVFTLKVPAGTRCDLELPAACGIEPRTLEAGTHKFTLRR
jgi:hypothetical protein